MRVLLAVLVVAIGCRRREATFDAAASSVSSAPDASTGTATPLYTVADLEAPCAELAAHQCDAISSQYDGVASGFDTRPRCVERYQLRCVHDARIADSGMTPDAIRACAHRADVASCIYRGQRRDTQRCGLAAQCASGNCLLGRGAHCGVCAPAAPVRVGERCQNEKCGGGLFCVDGICRTSLVAAKIGEVCSNLFCESGASCVHDRCVPTLAKGARCDELSDDLPLCTGALVCKNGRCDSPAPTVWKKIGERCDRHGDPCRAGWCRPDGDSDDLGRCVAFTDDGSACDDTFRDPCLFPMHCIERKCQMREYADCR